MSPLISNMRIKVDKILDQVFALVSLIAVGIIIARFGFPLSVESKHILYRSTEIVLAVFLLQEILRFFTSRDKVWLHLKKRKLEVFMAFLASQYFFSISFIQATLKKIVPTLEAEQISLVYLAISQFLLIFFTVMGYSKKYKWFQKIKLDPGQIIVLSFMLGALIGTLLLQLPKATYQSISWTNAAFTAISSICVTGLLPFNLAETFTPLGQFIIACLIQVGGLGIMTLTMVFLTLYPGSLSVKEKIFLSEMVSESRINELAGILRRIVIFTLIIESIGAIYLYECSVGWLNPFDSQMFYHSVFHSVSAFCNAGMTLFSGGYNFMGANYFTAGLAILIMLGGIGFPVISELYNVSKGLLSRKKRSRQKPRLSISTKLVLITSMVLWVVGALLVGILESNHSFAFLNTQDTIFHAVFFSITTRTAGFSAWSLTSMHTSSLIFMMMLMWIGASPISTGGGIKTLNFALLMLSLKSHIQGLAEVNIFRREISYRSILRAFNVVTLSTMIIAIALAVIFYLEPNLDAVNLAFEVVSAMGTVGLSVNITESLSNSSRYLIMLLMFLGRVGPYTLLLGIYKVKKKKYYRELTEEIQTY